VKLLKPKQGVYTFAASGVGVLKLLAFEERRPMPPTISAIVTSAGDCWTIKYAFSTKQDESITYCPTPDGGLTSARSTARQAAFGSSVDVSVSCSQIGQWVTPGMTPGQTWPSNCDTTSRGFFTDRMEVVGPITFVGIETVNVGGTPVQAYHMHKEDTITGAQDGKSSFDLWIAVEDGMTVRFLRDQSSSGIADYTEQVDLRLTSLTPRT
jgi:hypothetical protein